MIEAAATDGKVIAAAGTHPFSHWEDQKLTPKPRYWQSAADFQQLTRELVIFGCHVHIGLNDRETAVQVLNRVRPWLAPLLALSSNSPFWLGADTGYASFRTELWGRFPQSGVPHAFESRAEYEALVRTLVETGSIQDATRIYWDVRLPEKTPTIELRVTDVCMRVDEAVMIAALARGLIGTCYEQVMRDEPWTAVRPELLRAAHWRAARYGLERELIDVEAGRAVPACEMLERLLRFVQPSLEEAGDWEEVSGLLREIMQEGTGAVRQRKAYERAGRMEDVVDLIVAETAKGVVDGGVE
jgi:carboxylate-amine ligase